METTLLLVDPEQLPRGLEEQLTAKGAFVETTTADELEQTIIVVAPDLILGVKSASFEGILESLARQDPIVQLVLLADWKEHKALRARKNPVLGAILSRDIPVALLAGRIVEFGRRAAQGEPLQPTPSLAPAQTSIRTNASAAKNKPKPQLSATSPSPPLKPNPSLASTPPLTPSIPPRTTLDQTPLRGHASGPAHPAHDAPNPTPAAAYARRTLVGIPAPERPFSPASPADTSAEESPVENPLQRKPPAISDPDELSWEDPTASAIPPPVRVESARPEPAAEAPAHPPPVERPTIDDFFASVRDPEPEPSTGSATRQEPPTGRAGYSAERGHADHGPGAPNHEALDRADSDYPDRDQADSNGAEEPSERIPLTFSQRTLPPVRLVLVDTDMTRAGAIADELRRRGVTTQLLAPDLDATRWHLLRRFSPHGFVIDEAGLAQHASWFEAIRLDPFLRHVPLLVVPLERMFRENSGQADTSLLVPLLLSLGAEENALRDQLDPTHEIELRLDQIGPVRLLELLAARARPTRLECRDGESQLVWDVAQAFAFAGELTGTHQEHLPPDQALDWLLAHPECRIVAREIPGVPAGGGTPLQVLLEAATSQEAIPAPPPPPRRSARPPRRTTAPPPSAAVSDRRAQAKQFLEAGRARIHDGLQFIRREVPPVWRRLPPTARYGVLAAGILLLGLLAYLLLASSSGEDEPGETSAELSLDAEEPQGTANTHASATQKEIAQGAGAEKRDTPTRLFQVAPDSNLPPCDESVSVDGEASSASAAYLQKARQQLVAGNTDKARLLMCKAARLEPASLASEGLAFLYLSGRSLQHAQTWAEVSRKHNPDRRMTQELLGDIANQRGDVEEARRIWLSTMQLVGNETVKLQAVSRSQVREAKRAIKSTDLPRAERLFRRAITLDPENATAAAGLARVLADLELREPARLWAKHALELDPNQSEELGPTLRELGMD